jgi:hypothetical protein
VTVRLIKKGEQSKAKAPDLSQPDERDLQREVRRLIKAWKINPNTRSRDR